MLKIEILDIGILKKRIQLLWAVEILLTNVWNSNTSEVFRFLKSIRRMKMAKNWNNFFYVENLSHGLFLTFSVPGGKFFWEIFSKKRCYCKVFRTLGTVLFDRNLGRRLDSLDKKIFYENFNLWIVEGVQCCWRVAHSPEFLNISTVSIRFAIVRFKYKTDTAKSSRKKFLSVWRNVWT